MNKSKGFSTILSAEEDRVKDLNLIGDSGLRNSGNTDNRTTEDRVSQLPDEILTSILSFLTLKEAGRTSVLSKRWKHSWTYVPDLDFDLPCKTCEVVYNKELNLAIVLKLARPTDKRIEKLKRERFKFVNWVNKVLESHQTLMLNKFRIRNHLGYSFEEMNKWLQYAFDRGVERLEVNLCGIGHRFSTYTGFYTFPSTLLTERSWNSLKVLMFKGIKISGSNLELFLYNCKFLETLVVWDSPDLTSLEVCGPPLALRYLEISSYSFFNSLIVCNSNLTSIKIDVPSALVLKDVPGLVEFHAMDVSNVEDVLTRLTCCLSQLEVLSLVLDSERDREFEGRLPQLSALKQLSLKLDFLLDESSMSELSFFFMASPKLEKLILQLDRHWDKMIEDEASRKLENDIKYNFPHLKAVDIYHYSGCAIELDLVRCLLKNAVSLERITLVPDPRGVMQTDKHWYNSNAMRSLEAELEQHGRRYVKQQLQGLISHFDAYYSKEISKRSHGMLYCFEKL